MFTNYRLGQVVTICAKNGKAILRKKGVVTQEGFGEMKVLIETPKGMLPLEYTLDNCNPNPNLWVE